MMKVAYLILAHTDLKHLNKLIDAINYKCDIYIHIDSKFKVDITQISGGDNIHIIPHRFDIGWGGFNMVLATKELMKTALNKGNSYSHLVLLSGSDYPLKSKQEIYNYFKKQTGIEIIRGYNIAKCGCKHCKEKLSRYWFYDPLIKNKRIDNFIRRTIHFFLKPIKKNILLNINGREINPYFGSQWWALTPECVAYILNYTEINKKFDKFFKHSMAPDEMYFHTLVFNSKYSLKTINNGAEDYSPTWKWNNFHYLKFPFNCNNLINKSFIEKLKIAFKKEEYTGSIPFLDESYLLEIKESKYIFARKFNSVYSKELLDYIDEKIIYTKKESISKAYEK